MKSKNKPNGHGALLAKSIGANGATISLSRMGRASWPICASCATANARLPMTTSRRKSFLTCRVRKGTSNEYAVRIARLAGKAHANRLPRSRAEDCRGGGFHRDVSECLARDASGIESWICVQRCRLVCRCAFYENLSLAGKLGAEIQGLGLSWRLLRF